MADWKSVIPDFKAKAAQFMDILRRVEASQPTTAALQNMKAALLNSARWIKGTIETVTKALDAVANTLGMGSLGMPLIPIAVVVAAMAAMTKFITDAIKYLNQVELARMAQQQGATPEQVANILQPEVVSTAKAFTANWLPWVMGAGIVFLLFRKRADA